MKSEQALAYLSQIVVVKQITGSVCVRTGLGPFTISDNKPFVIARTAEECKTALTGPNNIKELIAARTLALVIGG